MKLIVYAGQADSLPASQDCESIHYSEVQSSPDAVFDEVEVLDALEYAGYGLIEQICKKIRHGGRIRFVGTDAIEVVRAINSGRANLPEASSLLMSGRNQLTSVHDVKEIMASLGLQIGLVGIMGNRYSVEGVRG
tara:strand:- start:6 stop:410 length:405 start_codon:yes stop_codon:yes gene_type:complete